MLFSTDADLNPHLAEGSEAVSLQAAAISFSTSVESSLWWFPPPPVTRSTYITIARIL